MQSCFKCGHVFRTVFPDPPANQTQMFQPGQLNVTPVKPDWAVRLNKWAVAIVLIILLAIPAYVWFKAISKPTIVGEWRLADSAMGSAAKMDIRPDGTGEISWGLGTKEDAPQGFSRPFKWRIEGSLFFFEPYSADSSSPPQVNAYKIFDENRYLTLTVDGKESTWRRSN